MYDAWKLQCPDGVERDPEYGDDEPVDPVADTLPAPVLAESDCEAALAILLAPDFRGLQW